MGALIVCFPSISKDWIYRNYLPVCSLLPPCSSLTIASFVSSFLEAFVTEAIVSFVVTTLQQCKAGCSVIYPQRLQIWFVGCWFPESQIWCKMISPKKGVFCWRHCSHLYRGSPIGFSGSGIWLIRRPGFGILEKTGSEIRDCNFDRDTGIGDFWHFWQEPWFGKSTKKIKLSPCRNVGNWPGKCTHDPITRLLRPLWRSFVCFRKPWS